MTGEGTSADPYSIETVCHLQSMRDDLSGHYVLAGDIDATRTLTWNDGLGFEPIGSEAKPFTGRLDGFTHEIQGLQIARPEQSDVGLFGAVGPAGEILRVNLVGGSVQGGARRVGALAGHNAGKVTASSASLRVVGVSLVGGLIGENIYGGAIRESHFSGQVDGDQAVGGLVGHHYEGTISKSHSDATVNGRENVGGLVGFNTISSTVSDSYSKGTVTGNTVVGGLVGMNIGEGTTITTSYSLANVGSSKTVGVSMGGLVGQNEEGGIIKRSFSMGSVIGKFAIGGLAGDNLNGASISDCFSTGNVEGNKYVGGLVGFNYFMAKIEYSYSIGRVIGTEDVGGLVGHDEEGTTSLSYWDTMTSGQSESAGGNGRRTDQMKAITTFGGWDFQSTWQLNQHVDYPELQGNPRPIAIP